MAFLVVLIVGVSGTRFSTASKRTAPVSERGVVVKTKRRLKCCPGLQMN